MPIDAGDENASAGRSPRLAKLGIEDAGVRTSLRFRVSSAAR
jgi:hypothetical protein